MSLSSPPTPLGTRFSTARPPRGRAWQNAQKTNIYPAAVAGFTQTPHICRLVAPPALRSQAATVRLWQHDKHSIKHGAASMEDTRM